MTFCVLSSGNVESGPYEDCCREMFGVHGYIIFTIDRLIQNITKQVSHLLYILTVASSL